MNAEEAARAALRRAEVARATATPLKEQIKRRRILASYADDYDALPFRQAFNAAKAEGRPDFPWRGQTYSTKTAEEQSREIAARAAKGSGRGPSAGMTAKDAETLYGRAQIPSGGGARAPAETGAGVSEAQRNAMNMLMAIPPARAAGQAVRGGLKAIDAARAARAERAAGAAKTAERVEPKFDLEPVAQPFRSARAKAEKESARRAGREAEENVEFKHGGKVKTYAKGGSVRGAGRETRHKKTRFV